MANISGYLFPCEARLCNSDNRLYLRFIFAGEIAFIHESMFAPESQKRVSVEMFTKSFPDLVHIRSAEWLSYPVGYKHKGPDIIVKSLPLSRDMIEKLQTTEVLVTTAGQVITEGRSAFRTEYAEPLFVRLTKGDKLSYI